MSESQTQGANAGQQDAERDQTADGPVHSHPNGGTSSPTKSPRGNTLAVTLSMIAILVALLAVVRSCSSVESLKRLYSEKVELKRLYSEKVEAVEALEREVSQLEHSNLVLADSLVGLMMTAEAIESVQATESQTDFLRTITTIEKGDRTAKDIINEREGQIWAWGGDSAEEPKNRYKAILKAIAGGENGAGDWRGAAEKFVDDAVALLKAEDGIASYTIGGENHEAARADLRGRAIALALALNTDIILTKFKEVKDALNPSPVPTGSGQSRAVPVLFGGNGNNGSAQIRIWGVGDDGGEGLPKKKDDEESKYTRLALGRGLADRGPVLTLTQSSENTMATYKNASFLVWEDDTEIEAAAFDHVGLVDSIWALQLDDGKILVGQVRDGVLEKVKSYNASEADEARDEARKDFLEKRPKQIRSGS